MHFYFDVGSENSVFIRCIAFVSFSIYGLIIIYKGKKIIMKITFNPECFIALVL